MTKRSALFGVLVAGVLAAPLHAQTMTVDDPVLQEIWDEAMDNSQLYGLAQSLLDSIGPRLTATPGMEAAQAWAVDILGGWGYDAGLEEYGTWEGWERGVSHIDLLEPRVRSLEGRILAFSPGTGGAPMEAEAVLLPNMSGVDDWEAFLAEASGKYGLIDFPQPTCRTDSQWQQYAMPGSFERMTPCPVDSQCRVAC